MSLNEFITDECFQLIITIVKKGVATRIVTATKKAGAKGGTILLGRGTAKKSVYLDFLGINFDPEKEIIFTFIQEEQTKSVLNAIVAEGKLNKPGNGIAFVINILEIAGLIKMNYQPESECMEDNDMPDNKTIQFDLVVTIVSKGYAEEVVEATKKAGAQGGTIMNGRGTGIHENTTLFGIPIEPEKEIVLTLIDKKLTKQVLESISEALELHKPGNGVAFVLGVDKAVGICHLENPENNYSVGQGDRFLSIFHIVRYLDRDLSPVHFHIGLVFD